MYEPDQTLNDVVNAIEDVSCELRQVGQLLREILQRTPPYVAPTLGSESFQNYLRRQKARNDQEQA